MQPNFLILALLLSGLVTAVGGQDVPVDPSIADCRKGEYSKALSALEALAKQTPGNIEVWTCLAFAYIEKSDMKSVKQAADKAAKIGSTNSADNANLAFVYLILRKPGPARVLADRAISFDAKYATAYFLRGSAYLAENKLEQAEKDADTAIELKDTDPKGYILKSEIVLARLTSALVKGKKDVDRTSLDQAIYALAVGVEKTKGHPAHDTIVDEYETVAAFHKHFARGGAVSVDPQAAPEPGTTPLKILSKPRPSYTEQARYNGVQGRVMVLALFAASGKVERVLVLNRLGGGLDRQAALAASRITFEPMMRDGKPVPTVKKLEYTFSIY